MSENKIVALHGTSTPGSTIQQEVVDILKELLAEAERGEIIGIVVGSVDPGKCIASRSRKGSATYAELVAAATMLQFDLCKHWGED